MNRNELNKLRRMAGVPQDFSAPKKEVVTEDTTPTSDLPKAIDHLRAAAKLLEGTELAEQIEQLAEGVVQSSSMNNDAVAYPNMDHRREALDKQYNQYGYKNEEEEDHEEHEEMHMSDEHEEEHEDDEDFWDWTAKYPDEEEEMHEAIDKELMPMVNALTTVINYLDKKAQEHKAAFTKSGDDDDDELADMYMSDMGDYKTLMRIVKKGEQEAARQYWRNLDTAARDMLFEPLKDKELRKHVADWIDTELLHEAKAEKDFDGDGKLETSEQEWKGSRDKAIKRAKKMKMKEGDTSMAFKKGQKVKVDGKTMVVEVPNAKADFVGLVPVGQEGNKDAVDLVRASKIEESMHYHTNDNYPISHADDEADPINVSADYETVFDHNKKVADDQMKDHELTNDTTPVKVPPKILNDLKTCIEEITAEGQKAKPRDYERANYYLDTAEAFQIVHDHLAMKTVEGLKRAQYLSHRMMNVQRALMPDHVWKFIVDGGVKRSLKSYMNSVDSMYPVSGEPAPTVPVDQLNKNTHTE